MNPHSSLLHETCDRELDSRRSLAELWIPSLAHWTKSGSHNRPESDAEPVDVGAHTTPITEYDNDWNHLQSTSILPL